MKKTIIIGIPLAALLLFCLFYFEFPLNLIRPVFHTEAINRYSAKYGLDPMLITAVIKVESNFFRRARSHSGAVGLMQMLPSTARELAPELGFDDFSGVDLENPDTNVHFGTYYIKKLIDQFNGNIFLALAAYNAGMTKVQGWYVQNPLIGIESDDIPYIETRNYVNSVMKTYHWLKWIKTFADKISPDKSRPAPDM